MCLGTLEVDVPRDTAVLVHTGHHLQDVFISEVSLQPCLCWDLPGICGSVC